MKQFIIFFFTVAFLQSLQAQSPSGKITVIEKIIRVTGFGEKFDGSYDTAVLAGASCVSGNCTNGYGRKILAEINSGGIPHIRIMEGKFKNNTFLGDGVMLIDGESRLTNGLYDLGRFKVNYKHNTLGATTTFYPKGTTEKVEGFFSGYLDDGIGKALPEYQQYVVCTFAPPYDAKQPGWVDEVYAPWYVQYIYDVQHSERYVQAQAKIAADNERWHSSHPDKCSCCYGRGTVVNKSAHTVFSAETGTIAYQKYVDMTCNCCHGTGLAKSQTEYKANRDGGFKKDN